MRGTDHRQYLATMLAAAAIAAAAQVASLPPARLVPPPPPADIDGVLARDPAADLAVALAVTA